MQRGKKVRILESHPPTPTLPHPDSAWHWFVEEFPASVVAFVLSTTARQWRVAHFVLCSFLRVPGTWRAAFEASAPDFPPTPATLEALRLAGAGTLNLAEGEVLYRSGEEASVLFVVLSGTASAWAAVGDGGAGGEGETLVRTVGPDRIIADGIAASAE